jgi:hypothetical protein
MKNLDSDLTEDSIGEDTGGDGVLKGLRKPQATPPQLLRHRELSVSEIELND